MMKTLIFALGLLVTTSVFANHSAGTLHAQVPPPNGNIVEQAFVQFNINGEGLISFCVQNNVTAENKDLPGMLLKCIHIPSSTAISITEECLGVSTQEGPVLVCGEEYFNLNKISL